MKFKLFARLKKKADINNKTEKDFTHITPAEKNDSFESIETKTQYDNIFDSENSNEKLENEINENLNKGLKEKEIIKNLTEKGYAFSQIDEAMTNVLQKNEEKQLSEENNYNKPNFFNTSDPLLNESVPMPAKQEYQENYDNNSDNNAPFLGAGLNIEEVEEIVNEMLYTKLNELYKFKEKTNKILENNSKKIESIFNANEKMEKNFTLFKKESKKEIADTKEKILEIIPRISSVEKACKEVIPNIVDEQRAIEAKFENIKKLKK